MSSDEDNQLKELVSKALEKNGVLSQIRAILRANVFLTLEESSDKLKEFLKNNITLEELKNSPEGELCLYIVHEFLEYCQLKFTKNILEQDSCMSKDSIMNREDIVKHLNTNLISNDVKSPILCQIVQSFKQFSNTSQTNIEPSPHEPSVPSNNIGLVKQSFHSEEKQQVVNGHREEDSNENKDSNKDKENISPENINGIHLMNSTQLIDNLFMNNIKVESNIKSIHELDNIDPTPILKNLLVDSPSHKKRGDTGSVSEIEEDLDSVEDLLNSSGSLRDDVTRDNSISTLSSGIGIADYMEDINPQP